MLICSSDGSKKTLIDKKAGAMYNDYYDPKVVAKIRSLDEQSSRKFSSYGTAMFLGWGVIPIGIAVALIEWADVDVQESRTYGIITAVVGIGLLIYSQVAKSEGARLLNAAHDLADKHGINMKKLKGM